MGENRFLPGIFHLRRKGSEREDEYWMAPLVILLRISLRKHRVVNLSSAKELSLQGEEASSRLMDNMARTLTVDSEQPYMHKLSYNSTKTSKEEKQMQKLKVKVFAANS